MKFPEFKVVELTTEEQEFKAWIKLNNETLSKYDPQEIAWMAIRLCGFRLEVVCKMLSDFRDCMAGSSLENRILMSQWVFDRTIEGMKPKELDLMPLWESITKYQKGDLR